MAEATTGTPTSEPGSIVDPNAPAVGADGKPAAAAPAVGADGKPVVAESAKPALDKDGKPVAAAVGADGKPVAAAPKAPETYTLKVPDGMSLHESDMKYVERLARAADLSNEDAQRVLEEQLARVTEVSQSYLAQTVADKEYGGDKLTETQTAARAVIARIRPEGHPRRDAFLQFLNRGGAGNHVEVIGFLADLGKLMREDRPDTRDAGGAGGGSDDEKLSKLYPNTPKK